PVLMTHPSGNVVCVHMSDLADPLPQHPLFLSNHPPPTEINTLSLHDALPISPETESRHDHRPVRLRPHHHRADGHSAPRARSRTDRKSTRLNSSHLVISYAVFCLKKKNNGRMCRPAAADYDLMVSVAAHIVRL